MPTMVLNLMYHTMAFLDVLCISMCARRTEGSLILLHRKWCLSSTTMYPLAASFTIPIRNWSASVVMSSLTSKSLPLPPTLRLFSAIPPLLKKTLLPPSPLPPLSPSLWLLPLPRHFSLCLLPHRISTRLTLSNALFKYPANF